MLFSATMTEKVDELIKLSLNNPLRLSADPSAKRPAALTEEWVIISTSVFVFLSLGPREAVQSLVTGSLSFNINCNKMYLLCRVVRIRRMREGNQEAVLLALCSKTFTSKVIIFRCSSQMPLCRGVESCFQFTLFNFYSLYVSLIKMPLYNEVLICLY